MIHFAIRGKRDTHRSSSCHGLGDSDLLGLIWLGPINRQVRPIANFASRNMHTRGSFDPETDSATPDADDHHRDRSLDPGRIGHVLPTVLNAYIERFMRSLKSESLNRIIFSVRSPLRGP